MITGPTGNIGTELIKRFQVASVPCIAAGRRNQWTEMPLIEYRPLDFEDAATFGAVKGVETVFLVRPPQISDIRKGIGPFLERCQAEGVAHVVFLSVVGVEKLSFVPHFKIEKKIASLGMKYSFIRAGFFMQNLVTTHLEEIRERHEIVVPCGKGKTTFVHARDIADVAFELLTGALEPRKIDVVGNDTLDYFEVAAMLSRAIGTTITYKPVSPMGFLFYCRRHGTPFKFALIMIGIYMPTRLGKAIVEGVDIAPVLKRPPVSFNEFAQEAASIILGTDA